MAKEAVRTISIKVNDVDPSKSINEIKKRIKELTKATDEAKDKNEEYYKNIAELGTLKGAVSRHRKQVRQIGKGWDETKKNVKGYKGGIADTLGEFLNFQNLTAIGLATTLVAAAAAFGNEIIQVSKEINKLKGDIQNLTDLAGEELDNATAQARALGQTFEADTQEIILAANAIQKEFGGSFEDALTLIEKGFLAGADANGEFLSQMKEYPAQFAAAGASAENFVEIVTRSTKEGVFSDKGADVVKEFGLRIREQTKATKDALEGAFGAKFTKQLFDNINSGAISTTDALKLVSSKMDETQIPAKQLQTVIADVYGGPGEDAGLKFIKSLENVGEGMDKQIDTSNDLTKARINQLKAEQELAAVQTRLSDEIQGLTNGTNNFVTTLKTGLLEIVVRIIQRFRGFTEMMGDVYNKYAIVRNIVEATKFTFQAFLAVFFETPKVARGVGEAFKQMVTNVSNSFKNLVSRAKIAINEVRALVDGSAQKIIDAEKAKIKARKDGQSIAEAFKKGFNSFDKKIKAKGIATTKTTTKAAVPIKPTNDKPAFKPLVTSKTIDDNQKNLERLNNQISKFKEEQRLSTLDADTKELEQIKAKYKEQIELAKKLNAGDEVIALNALMNAELEAAQEKHIDKKIELEGEALERLGEEMWEEIEEEERQNEEKLEREKEFQEKKKAIKGDIELELMDEFEKELFLLDEHYDKLIEQATQHNIELETIELLKDEKRKKRKEKEEQQDEKKRKNKQKKFKQDLEEREAKYRALGSIFASISDLMVNKQGEALAAQRIFALAQIAINAAAGIAAAIKAGAGIPFPGNLAAIASGVAAVTTGISQARKVFAQQKREGGYVEVIGKDDGKPYRAKRIGKQQTGMLPNTPVLLESEVLASEEGSEYFVSNKSLQNPVVMDLVRMIDTVQSSPTRQFKAGGSTTPLPASDDNLMAGLLSAITQLNSNIDRGLYVAIGYKEAEKIKHLITDLEKMEK